MNPVRRPNHDYVLSCLYDGVMAPTGFQAFIEAFGAAFQLKGVAMFIRNAHTHEVKGLWLHGMTQQGWESYALEYAGEDILASHIMASPIAHFYASNLDVPNPEHFAEFRFFREWVVPQGIAYAAGAVVLREGPWLTEVFVQRAPHQPPFTRPEMEQLNLLMPHLQRAIQMRQRFADLQLGQNFLAGGLDVLAMPTLLFNEYNLVVHHNRSAATLLAQGDTLHIDNGHLQTPDPALTRKLSLEIGNAVRASRGDGGDGGELQSVVLLPRSGRMPLMLMIAPLQLTDNPPGQGAALLFAFDPETTPSITVDRVRGLFLLSEAEAELAVALCGGKTLDEVASERGTSINTIKSQLKNIFSKTGTKRQTELVSLLLASPAYFLAQRPPTE